MSSLEEKWDHLASECPWRMKMNTTQYHEDYRHCAAVIWQSGQPRKCSIVICAPWHFITGVVSVE